MEAWRAEWLEEETLYGLMPPEWLQRLRDDYQPEDPLYPVTPFDR